MEKRQSNGNVFDEMGQFWAEIADQSQTPRQIAFLKKQLPKCGYVLDVACGTGRHVIPLTEAGFDIVGLDVSARLLQIAKHRGAKQLVRGDMRFLPFKEGAFSATISMDTSFGYLPSEKEHMQSLREIRRILFEGGQFIIDVFNREYLQNKYALSASFPKWQEYPSFSLLQKRAIKHNGEMLYDTWTVRTKEGQIHVFTHTVRLYLPQPLAETLANAGFTIETTYGAYEEQKHNSSTPRLIILASAK